ncbi:I66 family serine proteinase inhibitor [Streptosporangium sp. NPDC001559]|uniref:I66 family serine proteinase inhibitor n=1 Tax=Streptosporangium sp. NPDC001559 TaxID=3366187 RepID=UPI0036EC3BC3
MRPIRAHLAALATVLATALATVLVPGLSTAASAETVSAPLPPRVTLTIGRGHVVNIDGRVFAALLPSPPATRFRILPARGGVRFLDERTHGLVYVPQTEPFTQLRVSAPGHVPPHSVFVIEEATPIEDGLASGPTSDLTPDGPGEVIRTARIRLAGTNQYIGRNLIEDRSLLPKRVVLLPAGVRAPVFGIHPVF